MTMRQGGDEFYLFRPLPYSQMEDVFYLNNHLDDQVKGRYSDDQVVYTFVQTRCTS